MLPVFAPYFFVLDGSGKQRELRRDSLRTAASYAAYIWLPITTVRSVNISFHRLFMGASEWSTIRDALQPL